MGARSLFVLAFLSLGPALPLTPAVPSARAGEPNVTGTWKSPFTTPAGVTMEFTFEFKQEGDRLTGIITDPGGGATEIKEGQIKDGKVSFASIRERNGSTITMRYQGAPAGDTIKGTVVSEANGQSRLREWEARRVSEAYRPRTEWKFTDLASAVESLDHGRSFNNGKQMFQVANCVACHRLGGVGNEIGPDLTKLDPKLKPADILKEVLEPSATINEKYRTYVFETESGKVLTGLVLEDTPERIKLIENPLARAEPVVLKPSEVVDRAKSSNSIMPKGLLDKLTREEILDLVAYVAAGGDPRSPLFREGRTRGTDSGNGLAPSGGRPRGGRGS